MRGSSWKRCKFGMWLLHTCLSQFASSPLELNWAPAGHWERQRTVWRWPTRVTAVWVGLSSLLSTFTLTRKWHSFLHLSCLLTWYYCGSVSSDSWSLIWEVCYFQLVQRTLNLPAGVPSVWTTFSFIVTHCARRVGLSVQSIHLNNTIDIHVAEVDYNECSSFSCRDDLELLRCDQR